MMVMVSEMFLKRLTIREPKYETIFIKIKRGLA